MNTFLLKQGAEAKILLIENERDRHVTVDGNADVNSANGQQLEEERESTALVASNDGKKKKGILLKHRFRKSYRIPELDLKLTRERVSQEAKMIERLARLKGIHTPCLYLVDMFSFTIYMEYIDAPSVRDFLVGLLYKKPKTTDNAHARADAHTDAAKVTAAINAIAKSIGQGLAKIHDIDVIHGDLTTSNLLIIASVGNESDHTSYASSYKIVWIDFGLSYMSAMAEDKGVDLYVLERAILSTHPTIGDEMFQTILDEYEIHSSKSKEVIKRFQEGPLGTKAYPAAVARKKKKNETIMVETGIPKLCCLEVCENLEKENHPEMSARNSSLSPNDSTLSNPSRSRREMLKQYYQQAGGAGTGASKESSVNKIASSPNSSSISNGSQGSSNKRVDPLDIDTAAYHAELAFNKQVKEQNLVELLASNNNLVMDIKELDGNVKSLVYRNYSKFLAATDTIRKIKATALDMDKQVLAVDQKMNQITNSIQKLSDNLTPKRSRIDHLSGIDVLVKKLNFIIEMPTTLADYIEAKKYADAVIFYSKSSNLLSRYRNVAMFNEIEKDCEEMIKLVASKVQNRLFSGNATTLQISEGIGMLVALHTLPASDLAKQFMYKVSDNIDKLFASQKGVVLVKQDSQSPLISSTPSEASLGGTSIENPVQAAIIEEFTKFNRTFLTDLGLFSDCFEAYFVEKRGNSYVALIPELDGLKKNAFASSFSEKDRENAKIDLEKFLKDKLDKYFAFLDTHLKLSSNLSHAAFNQCVIILNILKNEVGNAVILRSQAKVDARMSELTVTVLDRIIHGVFGKVNQDFFEKTKSLCEVADSQIFNVIRQMTNWIKETLIAKALPTLEEFIVPDSANSSIGPGEILSRIKAALVLFWSGLATEMLDNKRKENTSLYLVLSRLSFEWSKGVIESIFSMYNERLFLKVSKKIYIAGLSEVEINKCSTDTTVMYQALAQQLLSRYAQAQVKNFVGLIRDYVAKPLLVDNVAMVSVVWRGIRSDLDTIHQNIKISFKDEQKPHTGKGGTSAAQMQSLQNKIGAGGSLPRKLVQKDAMQFDNIMDTLDKLFDERIIYLPQRIELKVPLVIGSITKSILKCMIEEIRQRTFSVKECHQFEVDLYFVRENFGDYLDHKTLDNLAQRATKSAFGLCTDPSDLAVPIESPLLLKLAAL